MSPLDKFIAWAQALLIGGVLLFCLGFIGWTITEGIRHTLLIQ